MQLAPWRAGCVPILFRDLHLSKISPQKRRIVQR